MVRGRQEQPRATASRRPAGLPVRPLGRPV